MWANEKKIPVTPWGAGTSLEGNPIPAAGGIVLDMSHMNQILALYEQDLQAVVQPGVVYQELNKQLGKYGLFFPPDPGAPATIGGMVANNAAGIQAVKYGATKNYVLKLKIVLPTGEIIKIGSGAFRSSSGYDLVRLFTGAEGTLGVITEITLRLVGIPPEVAAAIASFPSLEAAVKAAVQLVQAGMAPAALELLDEATVHAINLFKGLKLKEIPTLLLEFHGNRSAVQEDLEFARRICLDCGSRDFISGLGREERDKLWEARHQAYYAAAALNPGRKVIVTDVAVPISKLPQMVKYAREVLSEKGLAGPILGHAGDGNFHAGIFYAPDDAAEKRRAQEANAEIVLQALRLGGTATGEHGVGLGKIRFMEAEHGAGLEVMKKIKKLLDPNGIMNPGKIF